MKTPVPESEMRFFYSRSSGTGGQNVNKVNSKASMQWSVDLTQSLSPDQISRFRKKFASRLSEDGVITISSESFRDQPQNKKACIEKLHAMIDSIWEAPKKRVKTKATWGSVQRRLTTKTRRKDIKSKRGRVRNDHD